MISYFVTVAITVVSGVLVFIAQNLLRENDRLRKETRKETVARQEALSEGVLSLLRIQLFEYYEKYMKDGDIPKYVYENWEDMYKAYADLGGNGTIKKMNDDIQHLNFRE